MADLLDDHSRDAALTALPGWTGDQSAITRSYSFPTFLGGVAVVGQVAQAAEDMDHHPDIDIRWRTVLFTLSTHTAGGVTDLDVDLAGRIHALATAAGAQ